MGLNRVCYIDVTSGKGFISYGPYKYFGEAVKHLQQQGWEQFVGEDSRIWKLPNSDMTAGIQLVLCSPRNELPGK